MIRIHSHEPRLRFILFIIICILIMLHIHIIDINIIYNLICYDNLIYNQVLKSNTTNQIKYENLKSHSCSKI